MSVEVARPGGGIVSLRGIAMYGNVALYPHEAQEVCDGLAALGFRPAICDKMAGIDMPDCALGINVWESGYVNIQNVEYFEDTMLTPAEAIKLYQLLGEHMDGIRAAASKETRQAEYKRKLDDLKKEYADI